jgi:hypothetical protein
MKATNILTSAKGISIILLFAFLLTTTSKAQNEYTISSKVSAEGKTNFIKGIQSSNLGFKRDCIYFSTIYEIKEALDALKEQLKGVDPLVCLLHLAY